VSTGEGSEGRGRRHLPSGDKGARDSGDADEEGEAAHALLQRPERGQRHRLRHARLQDPERGVEQDRKDPKRASQVGGEAVGRDGGHGAVNLLELRHARAPRHVRTIRTIRTVR